jgi:hypothetical protein
MLSDESRQRVSVLNGMYEIECERQIYPMDMSSIEQSRMGGKTALCVSTELFFRRPLLSGLVVIPMGTESLNVAPEATST